MVINGVRGLWLAKDCPVGSRQPRGFFLSISEVEGSVLSPRPKDAGSLLIERRRFFIIVSAH